MKEFCFIFTEVILTRPKGKYAYLTIYTFALSYVKGQENVSFLPCSEGGERTFTVKRGDSTCHRRGKFRGSRWF